MSWAIIGFIKNLRPKNIPPPKPWNAMSLETTKDEGREFNDPCHVKESLKRGPSRWIESDGNKHLTTSDHIHKSK